MAPSAQRAKEMSITPANTCTCTCIIRITGTITCTSTNHSLEICFEVILIISGFLNCDWNLMHRLLTLHLQYMKGTAETNCIVGWLVVLRINVDLAIFQPYLDLEAGDNQSMKIQVARPGIEPRSSCSASQELNHSATAAPTNCIRFLYPGHLLPQGYY